MQNSHDASDADTTVTHQDVTQSTISDAQNAYADGDRASRQLLIINKKGLHARATAKFVQCAESFDCTITVSRHGETVGGDSIMGILTLGAGIGSTITVTAQGPQAQEAIEAIASLVANRFGEED